MTKGLTLGFRAEEFYRRVSEGKFTGSDGNSLDAESGIEKILEELHLTKINNMATAAIKLRR